MSFNFQTGSRREVFTVSQLNATVRSLLERSLGVVWVEGELSNLSQPSSGHWYFTLKDRDAQLRCAMFRIRNAAVGFTPKAGQHLLVRGRVGLYEQRGDYQLIAEHMEDAGLGALKREFERLKTQLESDGLFALERKRPLPRVPRRIGIVTSPSGAAIRDILHVLARRFPPARVLIYPTPVQGGEAVPGIVRALQLASSRAEVDVLIVARGGGSIEDLWAFNDERVARAISASKIPVITGIGHEVDFTIADYVADARAPTPSAAAELSVPDKRAYVDTLIRCEQRLTACMQRELRAMSIRFEGLALRLSLVHPGVRLQQQAQRLDDLEQRMEACVQRGVRAGQARVAGMELRLSLLHPGNRLKTQAARLADLQQRLTACVQRELRAGQTRVAAMGLRLLRVSPATQLRQQGERQAALTARLSQAARQALIRAGHRLELAQRGLDAVSPLAVLARGFAIVTTADGRAVTDAQQVGFGEEIVARLPKGRVHAIVTDKES